MKRLLFISIIIFFSAASLRSQIYLEWAKNGGAYPTGGTMIFDSYGNPVVASSFAYRDGPPTTSIVKTNKNGLAVFTADVDTPCGMCGFYKDGFDNYYVCGTNQWLQSKFVMQKFNSAGTRVWKIRDSLYTGDSYGSIDGDLSGNPVLLRSRNGQRQILRFGSSGNLIQTIDIIDSVDITFLKVDYQNNIILRSFTNAGKTISVLKYSMNGTRIWKTDMNSSSDFSYNYLTKIVMGDLGDIYLMASSQSALNIYSYVVEKINSAGQVQWSANCFSGQYNTANDMVVDKTGNAYVSGFPGIVKFNFTGSVAWTNTANYASSIAADGLGNVYCTSGGVKIFQINPDGTIGWIKKYGPASPFQNFSYSIGVDNENSIYVLSLIGHTPMPGYEGSSMILKYSKIIRVFDPSISQSSKTGLKGNFPNPFNPSTIIKFQVAEGNGYMRSVRLTVYDVIGREVSVLVNEELKPGTYDIEWNASDLPSGVYFYKLISGDFSEIKKMVLIK